MAPAYDAKRRLVLAASMDGNLYAVTVQTGTPAFTGATDGGLYAIPFSADDTVYIASLDKTVRAINLDTGHSRWIYETNGRVFGAPLLAGGFLWIGSNDGRLYELDPDTGVLRAFFQASERIISRVAYDQDTARVFARTAANEIYCLARVAQPVRETGSTGLA